MKVQLTSQFKNDLKNILNITEEKFGYEVEEKLYSKVRHIVFYSAEETLKQISFYRIIHEKMDIKNLDLF